jgi:hypothetical protein
MPTSDEVYAASKLKWQKLKITSATDLDDYVIGAGAYIISTTGRVWADWPMPTSFTDAALLTVTPELIALARKAHIMRVEQVVQQDQPGYAGTASDDLIQSMSVGSYSETRRDTATIRGGRQAAKPLLNTHPGLNALLEALMTEERFDFWRYRLTGVTPPAMQVEEVNWTLVGKDLYGGGGGGFNPYAPWTMWG